MTRLSVNINKIATIRNSRGENTPNVVEAAINCERFGAEGITVHPRPDERHIRYNDVRDLKKVVKTELNIEGYPCESFNDLVLEVVPEQVTLVPDPPTALTSNAGWDTITNQELLKEITATFKAKGIRVSIFVNPDLEMIKHAATTGCDRIELYTEPFASKYAKGERETAVRDFADAAALALELGLGVNAGHDLSLDNLRFFNENVKGLAEVSIGHALISDALYLGLENTVNLYKNELKIEKR
ncbi:MAG: pyridoxine 5'-phosphate synthase [Rikenellaceae bacterium]